MTDDTGTESAHDTSDHQAQHTSEAETGQKQGNGSTSSNGGQVYQYWRTSIEEDRAAAKKVEERIAQQNGTSEEHAAKTLQNQYKAYSDRRTAKGMNLTSSARWNDGMKQRKLAKAGQEQDQGKNDASSRWKRTGLYATQISEGQHNKSGDQPGEPSEDEEVERLAKNKKERKKILQERQMSKEMEYRYWLEMVDAKHRYASNLKWYHQYWNEQCDTNENFFHWLDEGGGKDLELDQCPRSRLDKERITYLSAEERQNYLVDFNDEGHLVWRKNGEPVHTSREYRDAGPNVGIVKMSEEEIKKRDNDEAERRKKRPGGKSIAPLSSSSSESSDPEEDEKDRQGVKGYHEKGFTAGQGKGLSQIKDRVAYYASPRHVMDHLMRKTLNKNTWLYVADLKNNLYVGIKQTGKFQHSSFLYGARVTSAGLLKVDNGKLTSLSPLSGHYKSGSMHFKAFLRSLEERGVDLSSVMVSKSILTIRGIEKYGSAMKTRKHMADKFKSALHIGGDDKGKEGANDKDKGDGSNDKLEASNRDRDRKRKQRTAQQVMTDGSASESSSSDDDGDDAEPDHRDDAATQDRPQSALDKPLPYEGKKKEDMTEDERTERGIALVQRAFERGVESKNKKLERDSKQQTEQDKQKRADEERKQQQQEQKEREKD